MPEHGNGLPEILSEIADRKERAAEVRFGRANVSGEAPRDVYLAGCRSIADALAPDGFTYAKSSQTATRKHRDFAFRISFQSSHYNIAGELVALGIFAVVYSPTLKKWGKAHPNLTMERWDRVAGGQIGNLVARHSWMEWNLASPADRDRQIADAIATIRRIALPYFALFEDVPSLVARLTVEDIPSFKPASALDFLMAFATPAAALRAARGHAPPPPRGPAELSRGPGAIARTTGPRPTRRRDTAKSWPPRRSSSASPTSPSSRPDRWPRRSPSIAGPRRWRPVHTHSLPTTCRRLPIPRRFPSGSLGGFDSGVV